MKSLSSTQKCLVVLALLSFAFTQIHFGTDRLFFYENVEPKNTQQTYKLTASPLRGISAQTHEPTASTLKDMSVETSDPTASPFREIPLQVEAPTKERCFISSFGTDGIGHQMEAKISCLATAILLNNKSATTGTWSYIHQPVVSVEHGQNPSELEELFGFSKAVTDIFDSETMIKMPRDSVSPCRQHPDDMILDLNALCSSKGTHRDEGKAAVHSSDNCWDIFYCQNEPMPSDWHKNVVPLLRRTLLTGPLYVSNDIEQNGNFVPQKTQRNPKLCFIVMHVRLGDAGDRKLNGEWAKTVWQNLLDTKNLINERKDGDHTSSADALTFHLAIHSDGTRDEVLSLLNFSNDTVFFMDGFNFSSAFFDIESNADVESKTIVSLYCRGERHATLAAAVYDMLTADIFISSYSSLSHTASFLRHPTLDGPSLHPPSGYRERMGTTMGWLFLRLSDNQPAMLLCVKNPSNDNNEDLTKNYCPSWSVAEVSFWINLFDVYYSRVTSMTEISL